MRILLVNKYYYLRSGTERYLFNLKQLLESHGHTVEVFAMHDPRNLPSKYQEYFAPEVDFYHLGFFAQLQAIQRVIWYPQAARLISKLLDEYQPDLVHLLNIYHQLSPSILPEFTRRGIPVVQTLNDYNLICPNYLLYTQNQACYRCRNHNYFQAVRYRCFNGSAMMSGVAAVQMTLHKLWRIYEKNVKIFLAPSRFLYQTTIDFGEPPEQVAYLPYFLDVSGFSAPKFREKGDYIAYFGRLSPVKGLVTLVNAMRMVPHIPLWIIGEGTMRAELESAVESMNLKNVHFVGWLAGEALANALTKSRATVLPSEWPEVFGQSIIESFCLTVPAIGARIGGIPELISEDQNPDGKTFPPAHIEELANCLQILWDDPDAAYQMGLNGQRKVLEQFNPQTHYQELIKRYEQAGGA